MTLKYYTYLEMPESNVYVLHMQACTRCMSSILSVFEKSNVQINKVVRHMRTAAGKLKPMIKPLVDACHVYRIHTEMWVKNKNLQICKVLCVTHTNRDEQSMWSISSSCAHTQNNCFLAISRT